MLAYIAFSQPSCASMQMKVPLSLKVRPLASAEALLAQPAHPSHTPAGLYWSAGGQHTWQPSTSVQHTTVAAAALGSALAQPAANATDLLKAKLKQVQRQSFNANAVMQDPETQQKVNAAAAVAANVPIDAVLYHGLEPVDSISVACEGARLVPKQLHPAWVAKRHMRPELEDLWRAEEQHVAVLTTGTLQRHIQFSRRGIAQGMLDLQ